MVSFIIIGKNESSHIEKCIKGVYDSIHYADIDKYEIIYVDSNSSDNTIDLVKKFPEVSIYNIYKGQSPASGRNLGAKNACYDLLFFIDGDNVINPDFLKKAIEEYHNKSGVFFTGPHNNSYFDKKTGKTFKKRYDLTNSAFKTATGWFVIDKKTFDSVSGFDERYKKPGGEDYDLTLRLKNSGVRIKYLEEIVSTHYTILYHHPRRLWKMIFNRTQLYARPLLYRRHFFDKYMWPIIIGREYTLICLIFCLILSFASDNMYVLLGYLVATFLKSAIQKNRPFYEFFARIPYYFLRDITTMLGFFFFWPRKPQHVKWEKIK
ncbi:MAG: glycosyltransferase [Bacteroidetes bacterium]|nr:glycosyltransferase [Bacteroidota bacterium]